MRREVRLGILFNLLKGRGPFAIIGIIFTALSLLVFIPLLIILPRALMNPYQKYDFKEIEKNGVEKIAKVTDLKSVVNVSVNYEHPEIIGYQYENNGQTVTDKFETLDLDKVGNVNVGSEIAVLVYRNQSIIKGLTPFSFPVGLFYILPGIFLTVGIPFLLIGLVPALRTFNLYKTGIIKDAYVVSVSVNATGILSVRGIKQNVLIDYYFWDDFKNKVFGESRTTDFLLLNEKKAGDLIKIFVSESDENRNCLVPRFEAMKYNWAI
jgi:hypothetical protein